MELIKCETKKKPDYEAIYTRLLCDKASELKEPFCRQLLKQLVYYGVKAINACSTKQCVEELSSSFLTIEFVMVLIANLTPWELITVFSVEKTYDGEKYQMKDYFYTMKVLNDFGMDNVIGINAEDLLWDYMNWDLRRFTVNMVSVASRLGKLQGEKGILEQWMEGGK